VCSNPPRTSWTRHRTEGHPKEILEARTLLEQLFPLSASLAGNPLAILNSRAVTHCHSSARSQKLETKSDRHFGQPRRRPGRRDPESRIFKAFCMPVFTGMTVKHA